jgi:hypothetical protein
MGVVYDPDNDPGAGGSHFAPSGGASTQTYDPSQDPGVGSGQGIAAAPPAILSRGWMSLADVGKQQPPPSETPIRDLARNAAAAVARGSTSALDAISNPSQLVLHPAMVAGAAGYDWLAPKLGLPQMTPGQRADLTGYGAPPEQGGNAATAVQGIGQATGSNPYAVVPRTPLEARTAATIEGAIPGLALGGFTPLGAARGLFLGGAGGLGGAEASQYVPDWLKPLTDLATNATIQGLGGAALPRPGAAIDPSTAKIAQTGRAQGVPFTAPDITPGSPFRTPTSVRATSDALQGNIIRDLGGNPDTGDAATTNRMTPGFLSKVRTDTGNGMDAITSNNDIGPMQSFKLLGQLQGIDKDVDNTLGLSPGDRSIIRQRLAEVRQGIDRNTGTMTGSNYQSLTKTGSPLDNLQSSSNSDAANLGRRTVDAMRDAFQGSLSPDDAANYSRLRYQWRLMNTVQPLVEEQRGQSLPMGDLAQSILDQSRHFDLGNRSMAYTGGGQLGDYMSQAQLIAGGPAPQGGTSIFRPLGTPAGVMAATANPQTAIPALLAPGIFDKAVGPYARSSSRTESLIDAAMNPTTRLQRALAALGAAGVP